MAMGGEGESPLETVGAVTGAQVTEAFNLLTNETRLSVLLTLWEAHDPHAGENALSFTELRDRVGVRQGQQFNYHLDQLVGQYVRKTDQGYELQRKGRILVQSIIAGTGIEDPTFDPAEIDAACDRCGGDTAVTYGNNYVYQVCTACPGWVEPSDPHPEGTIRAWTFEPTGIADRSAEEIFTASTVKNFARIVLRFEDLCPVCSGSVEWTLEVCEDHDGASGTPCSECGRQGAVLATEHCSVCKSSGHGSPSIKVLFHPAVVAFFYDHGVEIGFTGETDFDDVVRTLEVVDGFEETVLSTDPPRVRVTATAKDERLELDLNEEMTVVDVQRS